MKNAIVEKRIDYKGFPCVVIFLTGCWRCGYVGIPKDNKYFGENDIDDVSCHGGITYTDSKLFGQNDSDTWWIGFDTAHYGDGKDYEAGKKLFADSKEDLKQIILCESIDKKFGLIDSFEFRNLDYCMSECKSIVDQLLESEVTEC